MIASCRLSSVSCLWSSSVKLETLAIALALVLWSCDKEQAKPQHRLAPKPQPVPSAPPAPVDPGPPLDAIALGHWSPIRSETAVASKASGYVRSSMLIRTLNSLAIVNDDCKEGWYATLGGYICHEKDFFVVKGKRRPKVERTQANREALLPYRYVKITASKIPLYKRPPTDEDAMQYEGWIPPALRVDGGVEAQGEGTERVPVNPVAATAPEAPIDQSPAGPAPVPTEPPPTLASLEGGRRSPIMRFLLKDFVVTLDRSYSFGGRPYMKTVSEGFMPANTYRSVGAVTEWEGFTVSGVSAPAWAFLMNKDGRAFKRNAKGVLVRAHAKYRSHVAVLETLSEGSNTFWGDGTLFFRSDDARKVQISPMPDGVVAKEGVARWMDVNLSTQTLVVYEGARPVYVTLVSTGRKSKNPQEHFETPTGLFQVRSKHVSESMDGQQDAEGLYSIEDVPYVMFFERGYALHSAFWHDGFGRPRSHGCVNLSPKDARWIFDWSTPTLPASWHGIYFSPALPIPATSTWVWVHGETPS